MIATLRESKARLSELVERAASGEEVLITVNGRPKARLVAAQPKLGKSGMKSWARKLRALQRRHSARSPGGKPSVLEELREERW